MDTLWQNSFYAYLDAFLAMARSVPEVISACFGADRGSSEMKRWFDGLDAAEQTRRRRFAENFKAAHMTFRELPLSTARNISLHRSGVTPVEVKITGRFGVAYTGTPIKRLPSSEIRQLDDPEFQWLVKPVPLRPGWQDFEIDGTSLFDACKAYIQAAQQLIEDARKISQDVHGRDPLTPPPS
jgi:hypothetical protein